MQFRRNELSPSPTSLPPLAPRASQTAASSGSDRGGGTSGGRPRFSHRSRAGCWTCRGRKVKCDEAHPRCGPCTRLNKVCDWDHRWNFSDATASTQNRYTNVSTAGSIVWDASAQRRNTATSDSSLHNYDNLPSFADLTNDEERERKAETRAPGTFNVIVNPDSFATVPEYCSSVGSRSRRLSQHSINSSIDSFCSEAGRVLPTGDPNTVVLSRFEDAAPTLPNFFTSSASDPRPSLPNVMQQLSMAPSHPPQTLSSGQTPHSAAGPPPDHLLVQHFERFIMPRILPHLRHLHAAENTPESQDPIVAESRKFLPLHHAICAISLLSLHFKGQATWEDALERDMQATRLLQRSVTSDDDLITDGVFYLHFLLLIYDICNPVTEDNLWTHHLQQIHRVAAQRPMWKYNETHFNIIGTVLMVDAHAALTGHGHGPVVHVQLHTGRISKEQLRAIPMREPCERYYDQELKYIHAMTYFTYVMLDGLCRCGHLAMRIRQDLSTSRNPGVTMAAHRDAIEHVRADNWHVWNEFYPDFLQKDAPLAGVGLTHRLRLMFDNSYLFMCISVIYTATSMFPGQMLTNAAARPEVERYCENVLTLASRIAEENLHDRHYLVFAVFLAGFATSNGAVKMEAIQLVRTTESKGIGRNSSRTRELLVAVCEEQRQRVLAGRRAEEVDWISLAKERGLDSVDFGM